MLIKGADADNIRFGNSFDDDQHQGQRFDYLLANPPFGVEWKMVADTIRDEHAAQGFAGRFGAGLPRINDGSFLFLQHMISKMKRPDEGGARLAIVFNGSPLFTGAAGSGESEIRRWIIESDMLEAVVALPDQLFYNTGISTYFWVVTNRKAPHRRGKVQLIDARESFTKMHKGLGQKRKEISAEQIVELTRLYGAFEEGSRVKIFPQRVLRIPAHHRGAAPATALGDHRRHPRRRRVRQEDRQTRPSAARRPAPSTQEAHRQPVRHREVGQDSRAGDPRIGGHRHPRRRPRQGGHRRPSGARPRGPCYHRPGRQPQNPTPTCAITRNVPLPEASVAYEPDPTARLRTIEYRSAVDDYLEAEVRPYVPDAWHDPDKTKIGYEIPLNPPLLHLYPHPATSKKSMLRFELLKLRFKHS